MKGSRKECLYMVPRTERANLRYRKERWMKSTRFLSRISLVAALFASSLAFAIEMKTSEDFKFNIRVLIQARGQLSWDGDGPSATNPSQAPAGTLDTDFYIRRGRVYFDGVAFKYFTFYLMLDT